MDNQTNPAPITNPETATTDKPTPAKKPIWIWLIGCCLLIIIGFIVLIVIFYFLGRDTTPNTPGNINYQTSINPLNLVDLELQLEDEFKLESVTLTEAGNNTLEIRTSSPYNVAPEVIAASAAYIFSYVYPELPATFETYRLILTINNIDSLIIEAKGADVEQLTTGSLDQAEFIKKLKITNLVS